MTQPTKVPKKVGVKRKKDAPSGNKKPSYTGRHKRPKIDDVIAVIDGIKSIHEACAKVPIIGARDFDRLVDDISNAGLLEPVKITAAGQLVDGRSRLMACHVLGIPICEEKVIVTDQDPVAIARANLSRRHLALDAINKTADQLAMLAVEALKAEEQAAAERKKVGNSMGGKVKATEGKSTGAAPVKQKREPNSVEIVAKKTGVPQRKIKAAKKLKEKDPELAEQVEAGEVSLEQAATEAGVTRPKSEKCKPNPGCKSGSAGKAPASCNQPTVVFDDGPIVAAYREVRAVAMLYGGDWQVSVHDDSTRCQDAKKKDDAIAIALGMVKDVIARRAELVEAN
ncbi:hypothetical protein [Novipirellula artificiosorum]|uniref:ParB/Sulfiredoxin domain-containing protein n=1 Tax=Novipirellula artificiosorum TaxID=2528016 RepID=A0A5C6CY50_9BACT|nr:hypothetical protein [Novipirellula artificiosorum]TWU27916.1 hypothetical protein Poly41_70350 [Novipirellula artificiosorum]